MIKKIIFSSGGTGGHIFPAINLMKHLSHKDYEVLLITDNRGNNYLKKYPEFRSFIINADTPIKKNFFKKLLSLPLIFYSIIKSIIILRKEKPNLVFGFGGYVSFPISFASKFLNLPLLIYENNMILGKANKYLLSYSKKILVATKTPINIPEKYKNKICQVGHVLHKDIINYSIPKKNNDEKIFSVVVLGGSQGAEIFGKIVPLVIKMIKDKGYEIDIKQQCIQDQKKSIVEFYEKNNIKNNVFQFSHNILELISSSDLAISRCGASTTAELAHTFTPFIAVPIPQSINNHQYLNAKYYEDKGYCWILQQESFNTINLFNLMMKIIRDKSQLTKISKKMEKNSSTKVYDNIENIIRELI